MCCTCVVCMIYTWKYTCVAHVLHYDIILPPGADEERPWHKLVMCLPKCWRWQKGLREACLNIKFVKTKTRVEGKHSSSKQSHALQSVAAWQCQVEVNSTHRKKKTSSACLLCGSVKDATHGKNLFAKANSALLAQLRISLIVCRATNYCHICYSGLVKDGWKIM